MSATKKRILAACIIIGAAFLHVTLVFAQTAYKSIGPNGTIIYSDHPPTDGKIAKIIVFPDLPSSPLPPAPASAPPAVLPRKTQSVEVGISLYTTQWCGYCKRARIYLTQRRIAYRDIDVETPSGRSLFAQMGGGSGIPLLVTGNRRIRGFSPAGYDAFFARR